METAVSWDLLLEAMCHPFCQHMGQPGAVWEWAALGKPEGHWHSWRLTTTVSF